MRIFGLIFCFVFSANLFSESYKQINGEWRDTKQPRILKLELEDIGLGKKRIYEGNFYYEEYPVKMYGLAEFHEKTNEIYVTYTSQVIGGKETRISEIAKYTVIFGEKKGTRYIMLFSDRQHDQELGMFYFFGAIIK